MAGPNAPLTANDVRKSSRMIPRLLLASLFANMVSTSHSISQFGPFTPWAIVAVISLVHDSILLISARLGYLAPLHQVTEPQSTKRSIWSIYSWSIPVVIPLPLLITTWFLSILWFTVVALSPIWSLFLETPHQSTEAVVDTSRFLLDEGSWLLSFFATVFSGIAQAAIHFWVFLLGVQVLVREEEQSGSTGAVEDARPWGWDLDYAYGGDEENAMSEEEYNAILQLGQLWAKEDEAGSPVDRQGGFTASPPRLV